MNRSMIQSAVSIGQLQKKLDLIGNNLANSETTGYKSRSADFSSLLYQQINNQSHQEAEVGRLTPQGVRIGTGAKLGHTNLDLTQGSLKETDRELDVALLENNHLFEVRIPTEAGEETHYTRAGNFYLTPVNDTQLMVTDADGYPVIGEDGDPILLVDDFQSINIDRDGSILVTRGDKQMVEGRLNISEAVRPRMLESAGENRFRIPDDIAVEGLIEGVQPGNVRIQSKTLEGSNVDVSKQMTEMLMAQRAYQLNAKSISTGDQMMGLVSQLRT
ncbi:flagellar hook-basal body protein [Halobacillus karajensis]|uniref:Distal rod protein n=1 Tax=Halobacillus karajensis TaxID=195088 RepID=A0A024P3T6_9BACI|nr:flagellar hook-basal body protein [Halobacillus karajensis]CDQ18849.1 Distal rod protein [Halobacillus karajensis]CDQ23078.1 Distal rod protein [Halobacillus karajensis]CDQ26560.1 Distal rod protein [Halobacillus karajensis]